MGFHRNAYWLTGRTARDHILEPRDPRWRGSRELGVLAGTFPLGVGSLIMGLPQPHDGVIRLEETRLEGMTDHLTCGLNHFGMLLSRKCAKQMVTFWNMGGFGGVTALATIWWD